MLTLRSAQLEVAILDPVRDQIRLGARYCTGGYIYQVTDPVHGPLLTGPAYPEEYPPVFDGQGLPEAFATPLVPTQRDSAQGDTVLVLGVGVVDRKAGQVQQFCDWAVSQEPGTVIMRTTQEFASWALEMTRVVRLSNRTLSSETRLKNIGQGEISFRWYPHPFFPLNESGECCKLSIPVTIPEHSAYALRDDGFIVRKLERPWDRRGHYQPLGFTVGEKLWALERHPKTGLVGVSCDFAPVFMPIWGNCNTFSFEPFLEQTVVTGQEARWSITYDF